MQPLNPMLLTAADMPFSDDNYLFEWKIDGVRCVAHVGSELRLFSRHGLDCTAQFPELHHIGDHLSCQSAILDGELFVLVDGKPDFEAVMERYSSSEAMRIQSGVKSLPASYVVWDVVEVDRRSLADKPLTERKQVLREIVRPTHNFRVIDSIDGEGQALFEAIRQQGLEGMVAKRKSSPYKAGERSRNWIKVKNWRYTDCYILGYKTDEPGMILGMAQGDRLRPVGIAEFGMTQAEKRAFYAIAREIKQAEGKGVVWLKPVLRCCVKHIGTTHQGHLRDAIFQEFLTA